MICMQPISPVGWMMTGLLSTIYDKCDEMIDMMKTQPNHWVNIAMLLDWCSLCTVGSWTRCVIRDATKTRAKKLKLRHKRGLVSWPKICFYKK